MRKLLLGWVLILSVLYSALSIVRHNHFQSGGFDLGIYDQSVWQYSRFLWPYNTVKERFILGDHLNLTVPLLAPLYWIWDDVRLLLIFQAVWISVSAIAIYKLSRHRKFSKFTSFCAMVVYSLFYGIQAAVFFDFHAVVIGVGLIAWLVLFLETNRTKLFWVTLVLLLLTQENMGIALISLSAFYIRQKKFRTIAGVLLITGILGSIVAPTIIAHFSPAGYEYAPKIPVNPLFMLKNLFDSEEKHQVWLYSFAWFSFLPLLSPGAIMAVTIDLAQYFVTGPNFTRTWSPFTHHRAILAPFLILGTLDALAFFKKHGIDSHHPAIIMILIALSLQYVLHFPLNKLTKSDFWKTESWMTNDNTLITEVPDDASIATQQDLVPHLSHRKEIYLFIARQHDFDDNRCGQPNCWWLDFNGRAKFLVVDLHPNQWTTQLLETTDHVSEAVTNMERAGKIILEKHVGNARLYEVH